MSRDIGAWVASVLSSSDDRETSDHSDHDAESQYKSDQETQETYCICDQKYDPNDPRFMISCDLCQDWFHGSCLNVEEAVEPNIEGFICPICIPADGLIQWKSGRRRPLLKGHSSTLSRRGERAEDSDQAPLDFVGRLHDHVRMFSTDDLVMRMRGTAFRADYENAADTTNSSPEHVKPILVGSTDGLQMRIPEDLLPGELFDVDSVVALAGPDEMPPILDVSTQAMADAQMSLEEWSNYFSTAPSHRFNVYQVTDYDVSANGLGENMAGPRAAVEIDLSHRCWPKSKSGHDRIKPIKQCTMGVAGSYHDFRISPYGSSCWYHVKTGHSDLYLVKPTTNNLSSYSRWIRSKQHKQSIFFGDLADECWKVPVRAGATMIIPSGWMYATHMPEDTIVFTGLYLTEASIGMQLKIYGMFEGRSELHAPYPHFEKILWATANWILDNGTLQCSGKTLQALHENMRRWYEIDPQAYVSVSRHGDSRRQPIEVLEQLTLAINRLGETERSDVDGGGGGGGTMKLTLKKPPPMKLSFKSMVAAAPTRLSDDGGGGMLSLPAAAPAPTSLRMTFGSKRTERAYDDDDDDDGNYGDDDDQPFSRTMSPLKVSLKPKPKPALKMSMPIMPVPAQTTTQPQYKTDEWTASESSSQHAAPAGAGAKNAGSADEMYYPDEFGEDYADDEMNSSLLKRRQYLGDGEDSTDATWAPGGGGGGGGARKKRRKSTGARKKMVEALASPTLFAERLPVMPVATKAASPNPKKIAPKPMMQRKPAVARKSTPKSRLMKLLKKPKGGR